MDISRPRGIRETANGLLELAPDRLIALCRLLLAGLSLSAIVLDPTQPARFATLTYAVLGIYLVASAALAALAGGQRMSSGEARAALALDVAVAVVLMLFTEGPTSPFFAFFTFILIAATLRWKTRGAVVAAALLILIFGGMLMLMAFTPVFGGESEDLNRTMIRLAYLAVTAVMMTYLGAYLEFGRQRIHDLAEWPSGVGVASGPAGLGAVLGHAASVVRVPRLVVVWERDGDPACHVVEYRDGAASEPEARFEGIPGVTRELAHAAFATEDAATGRVMFGDGTVRVVRHPIDTEFSAKFGIRSVVSAPLRASACRGRVYLLDRSRWLPDHIELAEAIGSRLGLDLDHLALRELREREAAEQERLRLSRDVHDGVLQGLTAADLHLTSSMKQVGARDRDLLSAVRQIIKAEQRRLREFVEQSREAAGREAQVGVRATLAPEMRALGRKWNCATTVEVTPPGAACVRATVRLLGHLLSEAVANAVRHGQARSVAATLSFDGDAVEAHITDDGRGWAGLSGEFTWDELSESGAGPRTIMARTAEAGGRLSLRTSARGSEIRITLPREDAA